MSEVKFKVGDDAIVVDRQQGHHFPIGDIVRITRVYRGSPTPTYDATNGLESWLLGNEELDVIIEETPNEPK